jgi:NADH dehydrogenase
LAGQLAELSRRSLRGNFRTIDPVTARVLLLDAAPTILAAFHEALRTRAARDLGALGVEIHVNTAVTHVDELGLETTSAHPELRRIGAATKIWAAGVEASPLGRLLAERTGAPVDRAGRVLVEADLTLPGHPEVFVIGDLMNLDRLPGVAQVAIQSGRHAAATIIGRLAGDPTRRPFRYRDRGTMATISRFRALAVVGRLRAAGVVAWFLWLAVHLVTLTGFRNRLAALFGWTVAFLGGGRPQRVITVQQVFARRALEQQPEVVPTRAASASSSPD